MNSETVPPAIRVPPRSRIPLLRAAVLGVLFILPSSSVIRSAAPPLFEPQQGYYKARGARVTAAWSVDRTEVPEDGVLTATLTVRGADNPHEIVRPNLKTVKDKDGKSPFADRFRSIENVPDPPVSPDTK